VCEGAHNAVQLLCRKQAGTDTRMLICADHDCGMCLLVSVKGHCPVAEM